MLLGSNLSAQQGLCMSLILFIRTFSQCAAFSRRPLVGEEHTHTCIGTVLLPSSQTWTQLWQLWLDSLPREVTQSKIKEETRSFSGIGSFSVNYALSRSTFFLYGEIFFVDSCWRIRAHCQTWWTKKSIFLEASWTQWWPCLCEHFPITQVLINTLWEKIILLCCLNQMTLLQGASLTWRKWKELIVS